MADQWNSCVKCGQELQDDMRTGEFMDGSEATCGGCGLLNVAVEYQDGSFGMTEAEGGDEW